MKLLFNRIPVLIAAAALLMLSPGCGGNTPSGPGDGTTVVKPGVGSFYAYKAVSYDAGGSPTSTRFDTISVRSINETLNELTGLISMWSTSSDELAYVHYETNGDLTIYDPTYVNNDSVNLFIVTRSYPFGSHRSAQINTDSVYTSNGYRVRHDSVLYAGTQNLTVPAGTFTVTKVTTVTDTRLYSSAGGITEHIRETWSYYFAPSVGFIIKMDAEHLFFDAAGTITSRRTPQVMELASYKLL